MNKKVIERILKNLLENETYTLDKEETRILLNYIADLQRKEYNNSKAIEFLEPLIELNGTMTTKGMYKLVKILEGNNE